MIAPYAMRMIALVAVAGGKLTVKLDIVLSDPKSKTSTAALPCDTL